MTTVDATKKYKKKPIMKTASGADESLFGPPARLKQMTGNRTWTASEGESVMGEEKGKRQRRVSNDPEVMQLVTKDLIRNLRVPATPDPSGNTVIIEPRDYDRIIQSTRFLNMEDRKQLEKARKAREEANMEASLGRKKQMQEFEFLRKKNEKPSDLEQEAMENGVEVVAKATRQREEQDDEIKKINEYVLNAKCHAIRDQQLSEKGEIAESLQVENSRLDTLMEIERLKAVHNYDQKEKEMQLERYKGAEVIQKQIKDREQQSLLNLEKKEQETQAMLRYLERLQAEDLEAVKNKKLAQRTLMAEAVKCNQEMEVLKEKERERRKIEDIRAMEFLKEKVRQEEERQAEMERERVEKEREIARLRAQQERFQDKQAERDSLRAKRRQEEFERIARRKEKEAAEKKQQTNSMLIKARNNQVQLKEHFLAVQAKQDRKEFERVLKVQEEGMEADKQKAHATAIIRRSHAKELRKQVHVKEEGKITARKAFFQEGVRLDLEARERKRKLDEIKFRKLAELKAAGVPDKYCAEVSRRITAPPPSFTMMGHN